MTDTRASGTGLTWSRLIEQHQQLYHQLKNCAPGELRSIETRIAELEETILQQQAPDLGGTLLKLVALWKGELHGLDADSMVKRRIVDEIQREILKRHRDRLESVRLAQLIEDCTSGVPWDDDETDESDRDEGYSA